MYLNPPLCSPCTCRRPVEPLLVRRGEDDHYPGRSVHADQHGRHPPLGLEQRLAPRRTQGQVPVLPAAAQHHRLSEVRWIKRTLSLMSLWKSFVEFGIFTFPYILESNSLIINTSIIVVIYQS